MRYFVFPLALAITLCLCGCEADPEPKIRKIPHTFMVYRGTYHWTTGGDPIYTVDSNGNSQWVGNTPIEDHYALVCDVGHHHEVGGWCPGSWLSRLKDGQRIKASYTFMGYLNPDASQLLADDDLRNDEKLKAAEYHRWKSLHNEWQRREAIRSINRGPGLDCYGWPYLKFALLVLIVLASIFGCMRLLIKSMEVRV